MIHAPSAQEMGPSVSRGAKKRVLLLHGWLGGAWTFGHFPEFLQEHGWEVLPLFRTFRTSPRRLAIEELADEFETALSRGSRQLEAPPVALAHSLGGLLLRVWMRRHYLAQGRRPPLARAVVAGAVWHGVFLRSFARWIAERGWLPGATLVRQMQAPSAFLWELSEAERRAPELLPPILGLAGLRPNGDPENWLIGGREADGVVPAACSNPNALWFDAQGAGGALPARPFRLLPGYRHCGPQGLLELPRPPGGSRVGSAVLAALAGTEDFEREGTSAEDTLRYGVLVVRESAGAGLGPRAVRNEACQSFAPLSRSPEGYALFRLSPGRYAWEGLAAADSGSAFPVRIEAGQFTYGPIQPGKASTHATLS